MKRYLFILLCLMALPAFAADVSTVGGVSDASISTVMGVSGASVSTVVGINYDDGDDEGACVSPLILEAHMENDDSVLAGTPAGCGPSGKTTWTKNGSISYSSTQASDGTYSLYRNGSGQNATIPTDATTSSGQITFDLWFVSEADWETIAMFPIDDDNYIGIIHSDTNYNLYAEYKGSTTSVNTFGNQIACASGEWVTVTLKWRTGADPYLSITVGGTTQLSYTSLPSIVGWTGTLRIGNTSTNASVYYVDNLKVYNAWQ